MQPEPGNKKTGHGLEVGRNKGETRTGSVLMAGGKRISFAFGPIIERSQTSQVEFFAAKAFFAESDRVSLESSPHKSQFQHHWSKSKEFRIETYFPILAPSHPRIPRNRNGWIRLLLREFPGS